MKDLNDIIKPYIDNGLYPGVQWQINIKNKKHSGKLGYINLETKKHIEEDTIYRIWSMTKPIVAIAAMQLVENNKIKLDDPITKYLPEFIDLKVIKNEEGDINDVEELKITPTIKHLLLHTAGFSYNFLADSVGRYYDNINLFSSSSSSLEKEINLLAKSPLLFQPSTKWRYSVSMDVLARIIEVVEEDNLQNILKEKIFDPLHMYNTNFSIPEKDSNKVMQSYEFDPLQKKLRQHNFNPQKIGNYGYPLHEKNYARGGHGLFSTLEDYSKFTRMLHTGKSLKNKTIINQENLNLMITNHLELNFFPIEIKSVGMLEDENYTNDLAPYGWGLGFRTLLYPDKNHNLGTKGEFGWSGAAATYFLVDNKKNISAILMTQVLGGDSELKKDFYKFIYKNL
tara:strand:- start:1598 stop:2788 length:1191 start_codon:yes stop_codon:yes gene_type:complete